MSTAQQEDADLQILSEGLADYIEEKEKLLKAENNRLRMELQDIREAASVEVTKLKFEFDLELSKIKQLVFGNHRVKLRLETDIKRILNKQAELKSNLERINEDFDLVDNLRKTYESNCEQLLIDSSQTSLDSNKAFEHLEEIESDIEKIITLLETTYNPIEEKVETVHDTQTLKEELYYDEIDSSCEINEIETPQARKYEARFQKALQEEKLKLEANNHQVLELVCDEKINDLQVEVYKSQLDHSTTEIDILEMKIQELQDQNASLLAIVKSREALLESERNNEKDLLLLKKKLHQYESEMPNFLNVPDKVSFNEEIIAYRNLLDSEDARLKNFLKIKRTFLSKYQEPSSLKSKATEIIPEE